MPAELRQQSSATTWTRTLIYSIVSTVLGSSVTFGYNLVVINAPYDVISQFVNATRPSLSSMNNDQQHELETLWSVVVALYLVGTAVGSIWLPGRLAQSLGRRKALIYISPIGVVGNLLMFISPYTTSFVPLMLGRFVSGFQSGVAMCLGPAHLVDLPPQRLRGTCGSFSEMSIAIGIALSTLLGIGQIFGNSHLWHLLFIPPMFCHIAHALLMIATPDSPGFLLGKNDDVEALKAMNRLRHQESSSELSVLKEAMAREADFHNLSLVQFFKHPKTLLWPLFVSINLHLAQQLTGVGAVSLYASNIIARSGLEPDSAKLANFGLSLLKVVSAFIGALIVEKTGRRVLMLTGLSAMTISHIALTLGLKYSIFGSTIASFALFMVGFSVGPGILAWLMPSEMCERPAILTTVSICLFFNASSNLTVSLIVPQMLFFLNTWAFLPFAAFCFVELAFMALFLPETKNIRVHEIVKGFEEGWLQLTK